MMPQVTCFSCAQVLDITSCANSHFAGLHSSTCQRKSVIRPDHVPTCLLPLRHLPFGIANTVLLASSALLFGLTWDSRAHIYYAFLIVTTGINLSCLNTVRHLGPSMASILKGVFNYFFPLFLPSQRKGRALFIQLVLSSLTNFFLCLVTTYFHRRGNRQVLDHVEFRTSHWVQVVFHFVVLIALALLTLSGICRKIKNASNCN